MDKSSRPVVVWRFSDGKPGHDNQSRGLSRALEEHVNLEIHEISPVSRRAAVIYGLGKRFPPGFGLPSPDCIVGAGHGTHLSMLAARRARGGRVIVLMKPSLPMSLFDLCIVPRHDRVKEAANLLQTEGVLNIIRPSVDKDNNYGLVLIGGPSSHYHWDDDQLIKQIHELMQRATIKHWRLSTSRRTPESFMKKLQAENYGDVAAYLEVAPFAETDENWVPAQLERAAEVWVSEDSVSMIYEALSSGASVGVFNVPRLRKGRVVEGVDALINLNRVTGFSSWQAGEPMQQHYESFNEAERCARWICDQWLTAS